MAHTLPPDVARWMIREILSEELRDYPDFKVSNTPQGTRQEQRTPGTPDPPTRKDRST